MTGRKALGSWIIAAMALPAAADDAALSRCRAIRESAPRLTCYDAIPLGRPSTGEQSRNSSAAKAAPAPAPAERFGLEYKARPADDLATISSHIPGRFEGWRPGTRIQLANGQVWQVTDETTRFLSLENPRVTIRRGALGAFFMDFENDNRSPRVRRVQ